MMGVLKPVCILVLQKQICPDQTILAYCSVILVHLTTQNLGFKENLLSEMGTKFLAENVGF